MSNSSLDNNNNNIFQKSKKISVFKNILILLSLIYVFLIPFGVIDKEKRKLEYPEIQILIILVIATSGILEDLKSLSVNKNGIKLETIKEIQEKQKEQDKQQLEIQEKQEKQEKQDKDNALALECVDLQLSETIITKKTSPEDLKDIILKASPPVLEYIFDKARRTRKSATDNRKKGLIERTIPIFEALTKTEHRQEIHRFYAQLGYAYKDQDIPDWQKAKDSLEEAIKNWKEERQHEDSTKDEIELPTHYCFNWIICTVNLELEKIEKKSHSLYESDRETQNDIVDRINFVNKCEPLAKSLCSNDSFKKWRRYNPKVKIETLQDKLPSNCRLDTAIAVS